jgi:hypothetical protein
MITSGHSVIDGNNRLNKNAAVPPYLLMQGRNVYVKMWKWAERKL